MTDLGRRAYEIVRDAMNLSEGIEWKPWSELSVAEQRGWWDATCELEDALLKHRAEFLY